MDTFATPRHFAERHFASAYERYTALVYARLPQTGIARLLDLVLDAEVRALLALPSRAHEAATDRLGSDETDTLLQELAAREAELCGAEAAGAPVFANAAVLAHCLDMGEVGERLFALCAVAEAMPLLRRVLVRVGDLARDRPTALRALGALVGIERTTLEAVLCPESPTAASELFGLNLRAEDTPVIDLYYGMADVLLDSARPVEALYRRFARPARPPRLVPADYAHLADDLPLLVALLGNAASKGEAGVNVLLYGPPGTGKTELARVLCAAAGVALHEVRAGRAAADDVVEGRYGELVVAQHVLSSVPRAVLAFDEAEDLLPSGAAALTARRLGKAAFNARLETNAVPVIWISNEIGQIDRAYLRRFSYALAVKQPSKAVRRRIVARAFAEFAPDPAWIERIAGYGSISPGQIEQAARTARLAGSDPGPEAAAGRVLRNSMRALGQREDASVRCAGGYDPALVNCSVDVAALVDGIVRRPAGTLLFCGPPGTGKSELARHLADVAGRPLIVKRCSDLLSPWVGVAERNIGEAFEEAADEDALLLIDEIDALLSDRRGASASWELSQVSEFLTRIEAFDGLLVCTTNLVDRIDRAALRRFALKVQFDYLGPEQCLMLFDALVRRLGVETRDASARARVAGLRHATPGDFAAVERKFRILGDGVSAQALARAVAAEIEMKGEGGGGRIGF